MSRTSSVHEEIAQTRPFRSRSQEAYLALLRTTDHAKRRTSDILEPHGITLQQYNVLRILRGAGEEGLPTLAIGERMIERTPGVTRLIDRMESRRWVRRERCGHDRRRVLCYITKHGLELLARLDEPVNRADETLYAALDDRELETLVGYLDRLRAHLRALEAEERER